LTLANCHHAKNCCLSSFETVAMEDGILNIQSLRKSNC
jgi:hypothetical protein